MGCEVIPLCISTQYSFEGPIGGKQFWFADSKVVKASKNKKKNRRKKDRQKNVAVNDASKSQKVSTTYFDISVFLFSSDSGPIL